MWVDVWVEILLVWVDKARVGLRPKGVPRPWASDAEGPTLLKERRYLRKDATEQMRECFRPRSGLVPPLFWSFC